MSAKFPIADQIRHGTPVQVPSWWPPGDEFATAFDWYGLCTNPEVALFDVSVGAELYWLGNKDRYDLDKDFGPLMPPYSAMWMEWTLPRGAHTNQAGYQAEIDSIVGTRHAALIYTQDFHPYLDHEDLRVANRDLIKFTEDGKTVMCAHLLTQVPRDGRIMHVPVATVIAVDGQTGRYIPDTHQCAGYKATMGALREGLSDEVFESVTKIDFNPAWMALNLLNCRNVTTVSRGPAFGRSGREKRQGRPGVRYHSIQLPGMSRQSQHGRRTRTDEAVMAMHRVRGHFKTYTAEAPLMGRHVGTYWWGWQVRGNKAHGEIVADYQFKGA
jgi:hypothetical protein